MLRLKVGENPSDDLNSQLPEGTLAPCHFTSPATPPDISTLTS